LRSYCSEQSVNILETNSNVSFYVKIKEAYLFHTTNISDSTKVSVRDAQNG